MRVVALVLCLFASRAFADQFLGIEQTPGASNTKEAKEQPAPDFEAPSRSSESSGTIHGYALIGGNSGEFSGHADIGYYFNRFVSLDLIGEYLSYQRPEISGEQFGPEVDAILHGANPTPLTPFLGVGPGYQQWRRAFGGETFDKNQSMTASVFGGLQIRFTRFFGLQASRRRVAYLEMPPVGFDRQTHEPRTHTYDQVGFVVTF